VGDPLGDALVGEATKKSGLVWLSLPGETRSRPAWHVWADGVALLVTGGVEQPLPGIESTRRVEVTVPSKDKRSRLVTWVAEVSVLEPGSEAWTQAATALAPSRLNAQDWPAQTDRWARESRIVRLTPTGEVTESPGAMPDGAHAAPPPPTPATSRARLPPVLGPRARRRPRRGRPH
jgi:hypothetical protein